MTGGAQEGSERRAGRALLAAGSAVPAALITALADNALGGGDSQSLLHVLALLLAFSIPLTIVEALLGSMLPRELSLRQAVARFWQLFQGPAGPARLYALGTVLLFLYVAVRTMVQWFVVTFHHVGLIALCVALLLLALLVVSAVLYLPLVSLWQLLLRVVGNPSLNGALLVLAAFCGGIVAWGVRGGILGEGWDLRPPLLLLLFCALQLAFSSLLAAGNRRLALLVLGAGLTLAALLLPRTLLHLEQEPQAELVVSSRTGLAARILLTGRTLLDRDGDRYPALLGGRDCNEEDQQIHPGAPDYSGDGIDQDCDGEDESPP
ncbi:MAG: hypothetical protein FJ125_08710 [Deltaproteobacteria bacterium]|nr:hypothetical protein [Deltaproteobacteria bacterium]